MLKEEWLNKIYKADAKIALSKLPDKSIDMCVTDPPYKTNKTTGGHSISEFNDKWKGNLRDSDKTANIMNNIKFSKWLPEVYRVLKENSHLYIFVNDKNVQDILNEATKNKFKLHNILVWKKNNKTPNMYYMKDCEFIIFLRKGKSFVINDMGTSQYFENDYENKDCDEEGNLWEERVFKIKNINGKDKLHPTQKPVELIEKLITNSSKEESTILDPFMGSGSTAIACINTNRKFIGFELDQKYIDICEHRIATYMRKEIVK